jgi:hypothetical protein
VRTARRSPGGVAITRQVARIPSSAICSVRGIGVALDEREHVDLGA